MIQAHTEREGEQMDMLRVEKESSRSQPIATKLDYSRSSRFVFHSLLMFFNQESKSQICNRNTHTRTHTCRTHDTHDIPTETPFVVFLMFGLALVTITLLGSCVTKLVGCPCNRKHTHMTHT